MLNLNKVRDYIKKSDTNYFKLCKRCPLALWINCIFLLVLIEHMLDFYYSLYYK
jgi:hypothetical protein